MLICITVSTNYSDILKITLSQNLKFIDKWFIITSKNDKDTINLIKDNEKICIMYYDFQNNNKIFDKGGAIKMAQEYVYKLYNECLILLLDTDIYLPDDFLDKIKIIKFKKNTLYYPNLRHDFFKLSHFYEKKNYYNHKSYGIGFFQLYYHNKMNEKFYLYETSDNCSKCDILFLKEFLNKEKIDMIVYHFGKAGIHWDGRELIGDFVIDVDIKY